MCKLTEKLTEQPWETEASLAASLVGDDFFPFIGTRMVLDPGQF